MIFKQKLMLESPNPINVFLCLFLFGCFPYYLSDLISAIKKYFATLIWTFTTFVIFTKNKMNKKTRLFLFLKAIQTQGKTTNIFVLYNHFIWYLQGRHRGVRPARPARPRSYLDFAKLHPVPKVMHPNYYKTWSSPAWASELRCRWRPWSCNSICSFARFSRLDLLIDFDTASLIKLQFLLSLLCKTSPCSQKLYITITINIGLGLPGRASFAAGGAPDLLILFVLLHDFLY